MAFNSQPPRVEYSANAGQDIFTFLFKIYEKTDLVVYQTPSGQESNDIADILIADIDYTVTIDGDSGGSITLLSAAVVNDSITLLRSLPRVRNIEYQTNGDLLADTLNEDQNYQTYLIADNASSSDRAMQLSESSIGVSNNMPSVQSLQFLRWNLAGDALENAQAVVQEITEFNDTDFRIVSTGNLKLIHDLSALMADRTWSIPDKDINFSDLDTKLDETSTAQTKIGDMTIGESVAVTSWSYALNVITVNTTAIHNLSVGQSFNISGLVATTNAPNGRWQVATVVDTDTITFTAVDTPTGTATVSSALLKHGTLKAFDALTINDSILAPIGLAPMYANRAWVNFNGVGTVAIRKSGNVSSITDSGVGIYDVNFIVAMEDADYGVGGSCGDTSTPRTGKLGVADSDTPLTTSCRIRLYNASNSAMDSARVHVNFNR